MNTKIKIYSERSEESIGQNSSRFDGMSGSFGKPQDDYSCHPEPCLTKQTAFTLAEVLITLGIIGVVAAMTLPTLIKKYEEKAMITRLQQTYTILSEAHKFAVLEHGDPVYWDIGKQATADGALKLYNIYKPYFKRLQDCEKKSGCFGDHYKALFNDNYGTQPSTQSIYAKGILANGVSIHAWSGGSGCKYTNNICGELVVDLNGKQKPNRAGVDYFGFTISPTKGILPSGQLAKQDLETGNRCIYNDKTSKNGKYCAYWAITRGNMDYLRRDIDSEW